MFPKIIRQIVRQVGNSIAIREVGNSFDDLDLNFTFEMKKLCRSSKHSGEIDFGYPYLKTSCKTVFFISSFQPIQ